MIITIHYFCLFIAICLAAYGIYLIVKKEWIKLTAIAFVFAVVVFVIAHVIPEFSKVNPQTADPGDHVVAVSDTRVSTMDSCAVIDR